MELQKREVPASLIDVLRFVESENGVRAVDVSLKFGTKQQKAANMLAELERQGKVYCQIIEGLSAPRWFAVKIQPVWRINKESKRTTYF